MITAGTAMLYSRAARHCCPACLSDPTTQIRVHQQYCIQPAYSPDSPLLPCQHPSSVASVMPAAAPLHCRFVHESGEDAMRGLMTVVVALLQLAENGQIEAGAVAASTHGPLQQTSRGGACIHCKTGWCSPGIVPHSIGVLACLFAHWLTRVSAVRHRHLVIAVAMHGGAV
jgi:hypothetical protein